MPRNKAFFFNRSKRFLKINPECTQAFYTYQSYLSNKGSAFGLSKRSDFTRALSISPPATKYSHQSMFDKKAQRGKSIGVSRESSPEQSYLRPQLLKNPGPGAYCKMATTASPIRYSMREKTRDFIADKISFKNNPGPGAYREIDLNPSGGRLKVSKFSDIKLAKINKSLRFSNNKETPGPSSYLQGDSLSSRGKYLLSHRKGQGNRCFDQEKKFTGSFWKTSQNPGPNAYEPYIHSSDFPLPIDRKSRTMSEFRAK